MENGELLRTRRPAWISILNSPFSIQLVGGHFSNPWPCWLRRGTGVRRPRISSCPRRSQKLRRRSVAVPERLGSYESLVLRGARPLARGYSSGSSPSRCRLSEATTFPRVSWAIGLPRIFPLRIPPIGLWKPSISWFYNSANPNTPYGAAVFVKH
jgi:hypothetical protein